MPLVAHLRISPIPVRRCSLIKFWLQGDGKAPETAFVLGDRLSAEYQVMRYLGLNAKMQALSTIRGCKFDILTADNPGNGDPRAVYFKLGNDTLGPGAVCELRPN